MNTETWSAESKIYDAFHMRDMDALTNAIIELKQKLSDQQWGSGYKNALIDVLAQAENNLEDEAQLEKWIAVRLTPPLTR